MKKLLLLLLCVPLITLSQQTYVPDDNFESYLESNGMGNGIPDDDYAIAYKNRGIAKKYAELPYCSDYKRACDLGREECCEWYYKQCK